MCIRDRSWIKHSSFLGWIETSSEPEITVQAMEAREPKEIKDFTGIHPFNKSNICRFPLMTSNSCSQILFRNVQRPKTRKEIEKVLGLCTFLNKIWKHEFDVISGKRHILDLLRGCIILIALFWSLTISETVRNTRNTSQVRGQRFAKMADVCAFALCELWKISVI